jgi:PAS domain S-box-containing protein
MKSMHAQIRPTRAIGVLSALTITLIALYVAFLVWDLRLRELERARLETASLAEIFREETEQSFGAADTVLQGVQERLQTSFGTQLALDGPEIHLLLNTRVAGMRQLSALFLVDAFGNMVNSSGDSVGSPVPMADRDFYKAFADGRPDELLIGKPVRNRGRDSWTLHLARPFSGPDGRFRGVVVAAMDIARFEQLFTFMKLDYVRPMSVYLADGTLVASIPHRDNMIGDHPPELANETLPQQGVDVRIVRHLSGDGGRQVFALARLRQLPLLVSVTNDEEVALASWRETSVPIALGGLLAGLFISVAAGYLSRELTRQAQLAAALRDANNRYHQTIESVMDAIVATDEAQIVRLFNPAAERMFGYSADQVIGGPLERLIPPRSRKAHHVQFERFAHGVGTSRAMAPNIEITGLRADGTEFPIESTISQTTVGGRPQMIAVLRDVTQRRRAESDLREMNRQLRSLSASLQDVREQERTRIALELHDDLGQQLTGLKLELSWLGGRVKEGRAPTADEVDAMRRQLDAAISSVRRIATELRPLVLDDLGFGEAVKWQTEEFAKRSGLKIELDLPAADLVRDDALATALFRIVQESLTNIARHAAANTVAVRLAVEGEELVLTVRDDGKGLAEEARHGNGIGLVSMRERATALGGQLSIASGPGGGTTVKVTLPLDAPVLAGENA